MTAILPIGHVFFFLLLSSFFPVSLFGHFFQFCFLFFQIADMLPNILTQLGPEGLNHLKRLASNVVQQNRIANDDEDVPDLIENFEEASKTEIDNITKKTEEVTVA